MERHVIKKAGIQAPTTSATINNTQESLTQAPRLVTYSPFWYPACRWRFGPALSASATFRSNGDSMSFGAAAMVCRRPVAYGLPCFAGSRLVKRGPRGQPEVASLHDTTRHSIQPGADAEGARTREPSTRPGWPTGSPTP